MIAEISMPQLSETMQEGRLLRWLIKPGQRVAQGDVIAEVETDKANMEVETPCDGRVTELMAKPGDSLPVGAVLALIDSGDIAEAAQTKPLRTPKSGVNASTLAVKLARELGLDLTTIEGTGPNGRILKEDVQRAAAEADEEPPAEEEPSAVVVDLSESTPDTDAGAHSEIHDDDDDDDDSAAEDDDDDLSEAEDEDDDDEEDAELPVVELVTSSSEVVDIFAPGTVTDSNGARTGGVAAPAQLDVTVDVSVALACLPEDVSSPVNYFAAIYARAAALAAEKFPLPHANADEVSVRVACFGGPNYDHVLQGAAERNIGDTLAILEQAEAGESDTPAMPLHAATVCVVVLEAAGVEKLTGFAPSPGQSTLSIGALHQTSGAVPGAIHGHTQARVTLSTGSNDMMTVVASSAFLNEFRRLVENPILLCGLS